MPPSQTKAKHSLYDSDTKAFTPEAEELLKQAVIQYKASL